MALWKKTRRPHPPANDEGPGTGPTHLARRPNLNIPMYMLRSRPHMRNQRNHIIQPCQYSHHCSPRTSSLFDQRTCQSQKNNTILQGRKGGPHRNDHSPHHSSTPA